MTDYDRWLDRKVDGINREVESRPPQAPPRIVDPKNHAFVGSVYVGFMRVESGLCAAIYRKDGESGFHGCNLPKDHPFHLTRPRP